MKSFLANAVPMALTNIALPNAGAWTLPEDGDPSLCTVLVTQRGHVGILLQQSDPRLREFGSASTNLSCTLGDRCHVRLVDASSGIVEVTPFPAPDIARLSFELPFLHALLDTLLRRVSSLPGHDKLTAIRRSLETIDDVEVNLDRLADLLLTTPATRLEYLLEGNIAQRVNQLIDRLNGLIAFDSFITVSPGLLRRPTPEGKELATVWSDDGLECADNDPSNHHDTQEFEDLLRRIATNLPTEVTESTMAIVREILLDDTDAATRRLQLLKRIPWERNLPSKVPVSEILAEMSHSHIGHSTTTQRLGDIALRITFARNRGTSPSERAVLLVGPPGIGKTSLAFDFAVATRRKFQQISMSQVIDQVSLIGSSPQFYDSGPGQILTAIIASGVSDPVICLDEIDRMGSGGPGAKLSSVLLSILDDSIGGCFKDSFLGVPVNVSEVTWICTANDVEHIDAALLDRMEVVPMSEPSFHEMFEITRRVLLPRAIGASGLRVDEVDVCDDGIAAIVTSAGNGGSARMVQARIRSVLTSVISDILQGTERIHLDHEYVQLCRRRPGSQ